MSEISQAAFSRLTGVSKAAINKAIKSGKLELERTKKIDDQHPLSIQYLRKNLEKSIDIFEEKKNPVVRAKKQVKKPLSKTVNKKTKAPVKKTEKKTVTKLEPDLDYLEIEKQKAEARAIVIEKNRIANELQLLNAEKIKLANAEKMKLLVPVEIMKRRFGLMANAILNHFFPLGDRLAPMVCGICGINDPEKVREVKNRIDDEVTRAMAEFKKVALGTGEK